VTADGDRTLSSFESVGDLPSAAEAPAIEHGGDAAAATARYGMPPDGWIDLSTGINPYPYRPRRLDPADMARLPGQDDLARLHEAAGAFFGLPRKGGLVPAPGSQALIQWLPRLFSPRSVAIVAPTYGEHAHAWTLAGHRIRTVAAPSADAAEILVLCNPNNPDGQVRAPDDLRAIAARLAERGGLLVVDEAFVDMQPALSVIDACDRPGLVVLRSFGKFFGLAGLRLGFAACETGLATRLAEAIGPWAVAGPTLAIARMAYEDHAWIARTRRTLLRQSARLDRLLATHGLAHIGGTPLFTLRCHDDAAILADRLAHAGIWVRRFAAHPDRLRFGLPGPAAAWHRLQTALTDWTMDRNTHV
jgi:cobalamin biosynthetic protein CobC